MRPLVRTMANESPFSAPEETGPPPPAGPLPFYPSVGWANIIADSVLATGPVHFWGIVLTHGLGVIATVYDGVNANGRRVCAPRIYAGFSMPVVLLFKRPLLLQNGLFVDLSAAPDDCLVLFDPLPSS